MCDGDAAAVILSPPGEKRWATMQHNLGIDSQTIFGMPPVEHVTLAADLECTHVSLGFQPVPWKLEEFPAWSLRDDRALRRELRAVMRDRGVSLALAEGLIIRPGSDLRDRTEDIDLFAELGAARLGTVSMDPDHPRALDQLAALAEMAAERNMGVVLEFAPPHPINNLAAALSAIERIGMPNVGLVIDAMHFFRSGSTLDELAAIDPTLLRYAQLCDAPLDISNDDYLDEACFNRMSPGTGDLPLRELIDALPADIPFGLETPMLDAIKDSPGIHIVVEDLVRRTRDLLGARSSA